MNKKLPLLRNRRIKTPPGTWIRPFLEVALFPRYRKRHLEPIYRETTEDWLQAHVRGGNWRFAIIAIRFYASLAIELFRLPFALVLKLWRS